jgi:hypothetical protein
MLSKNLKLVGLNVSDLYRMINEKEALEARNARLIPTQKPGDEVTLTSVFLASLRPEPNPT